MPRELAKVERHLKRYFKRLVIATVVVYLALAAITLYTLLESSTTNAALCAFNDDLQNRVIQAQRFVNEHPNGFGGIPISAIEVELKNERRTLHSLHILSC